MQKLFSALHLPKLLRHYRPSGAVAGLLCHEDGGLRRNVNGPVNNGASAPLHPVSESCRSRAARRVDK